MGLLATTQLERTLEGAPIILLMTVGAVVVLFWVFLPIVVWSRLNEIVKLLKEIRDDTAARVDGPKREIRLK